MSCWVVPSVAAELWGVSVQHVTESARQGTIPCKNELGFLVVDVAPSSSGMGKAPPPPTFVQAAPAPVVAAPRVRSTSDEEPDWKLVRRLVGSQRRAPRKLVHLAA